jgi:hypothetical protein
MVSLAMIWALQSDFDTVAGDGAEACLGTAPATGGMHNAAPASRTMTPTQRGLDGLVIICPFQPLPHGKWCRSPESSRGQVDQTVWGKCLLSPTRRPPDGRSASVDDRYDGHPLRAKEICLSRIDPARLGDLQDVLAQVRSWTGVDDRGSGTFYLHRKPFLHFHAGRDSRRADVRRAEGWVQIDLPEPAPATARSRFLAVLRAEYADR